MDESMEESPFAAFATPKRSAAEAFVERQHRAAAARRMMIGCVLAALVGSTGGATSCAAFDADLDVAFAALVGSFLGGFGGVILGIVVGAMCFGAISMARTRGMPDVGADLARRDPMAAMRGLLFAWALIGVALGAAAGAQSGVEWAGVPAGQQTLARWTVIGSLLGGAFALAVWFATLRSIVRRNSATDPN